MTWVCFPRLCCGMELLLQGKIVLLDKYEIIERVSEGLSLRERNCNIAVTHFRRRLITKLHCCHIEEIFH